MGHSASYHLPTHTAFPFLLECCIYSINSFSINVTEFGDSADSVPQLNSRVFSASPAVHDSLFDVHLLLLMN